jgi:hypothetical protein
MRTKLDFTKAKRTFSGNPVKGLYRRSDALYPIRGTVTLMGVDQAECWTDDGKFISLQGRHSPLDLDPASIPRESYVAFDLDLACKAPLTVNESSIGDATASVVAVGSYSEENAAAVRAAAQYVGSLPSDDAQRKAIPLMTGCFDYFPDALIEVARVSEAATAQHHPGETLHWDKNKSPKHADSLARHLLERGKRDSDGQRHSAKVAWRSLALLQIEIENERKGLTKP